MPRSMQVLVKRQKILQLVARVDIFARRELMVGDLLPFAKGSGSPIGLVIAGGSVGKPLGHDSAMRASRPPRIQKNTAGLRLAINLSFGDFGYCHLPPPAPPSDSGKVIGTRWAGETNDPVRRKPHCFFASSTQKHQPTPEPHSGPPPRSIRVRQA